MPTALARLEAQIVALHGRLNVRPTLVTAAQIGELLVTAKREVEPGEFHKWVRSRLKISPRLAQTYIQIADAQSSAPLPDNVSIDRFLRMMRATSKPKPEPPPDTLDRPVPEAKVYKADCRTWRGWPERADAICCDPPWKKEWADLYDWLGEWAAQILRPGGLALVQCGTATLPDRIGRLTKHGLRYLWVMSIVYPTVHGVRPAFGFASCWRPVVVLAKEPFKAGASPVSDVVTVGQRGDKHHHIWEQPVAAWAYWCDRLSVPGAVILDPFSGAATTGVATLRAAGGRTWIGTDCDDGAVRTARRRLRAEVERAKEVKADAEHVQS